MKPEKISQLSGIFAPTITGYHSDGSISLEGTRKFVRFLLNSGADGLTPLGSAGEPVALTLEERKSLLEAIVAENAGQVPIYAGTGDYGTETTIELSLHAKALGC
ncbi:MAG TPA: dihydrodipicolinate synthase family protein, partial [Terriglobia bacterium]|nr:dihydrodipicolinate synthase family protein [Terriglobia bacterium]